MKKEFKVGDKVKIFDFEVKSEDTIHIKVGCKTIKKKQIEGLLDIVTLLNEHNIQMRTFTNNSVSLEIVKGGKVEKVECLTLEDLRNFLKL